MSKTIEQEPEEFFKYCRMCKYSSLLNTRNHISFICTLGQSPHTKSCNVSYKFDKDKNEINNKPKIELILNAHRAEYLRDKMNRLKAPMREKKRMKNEVEGQQKLEAVNVPIGEIELPTIDITPYIGRKVKILDVGTFKGEFGFLIKAQTEIVETIRGGKKDIELRGSRIFGLQEDNTGNVGWGSETKLGLFLKKMKVKKPTDLIGKEVVLQSQTTKTGTEYLTFN